MKLINIFRCSVHSSRLPGNRPHPTRHHNFHGDGAVRPATADNPPTGNHAEPRGLPEPGRVFPSQPAAVPASVRRRGSLGGSTDSAGRRQLQQLKIPLKKNPPF